MKAADRFTPARIAAFLLVFLLVGVAACTPPGPPPTGTGPGGPTAVPPPNGPQPNGPPNDVMLWQTELRDGNYGAVIEQTSAALAAYPENTEAALYRGLAELASGNPDAARQDLQMAEAQAVAFPSERTSEDQLLLYRGLMIVTAQRGEPETAQMYYSKAVDLAPAQRSLLSDELQNQGLSIQNLIP